MVDPGTSFALDFNFRNPGSGSGSDVTFTATMKDNDFFGAEHTFLTRTVAFGTGTNVASHLVAPTTVTGTDDVKIEITSSGTGASVIASCEVTLTVDRDTDADGLADSWETTGIDADGDHTPDLTLPGANPKHKDIYLEIDHMTDHVLRSAARQDVIDAFAAAPVQNPDGSTGLTMHIEEDEEITHRDDVTTWSGFDAIKPGTFGTPAQRASAAVLNAKRKAYHYVILGHRRDSGNSSGRAEIHGNDVFVTLGDPAWGLNDSGTHRIGTRTEQAGTLMHELGHNLGLDHGGDKDVNCKPNYISIMSYTFQMRQIPQADGTRKLDYSRQKLNTLNEAELKEKDGVGDAGTNFTFWSADGGAGGLSSERANGGLDWNESNALDDAPVKHIDINNLGFNGCRATPDETLEGYDDWANLDLNFRDDGDFADGTHGPTPVELDGETAKVIEQRTDEALAPKAEAGGPYTSPENAEVAFQGSATGLGALSYAWDFGDGLQGTGATAKHVYGDDGTFTATLTVTDPSGRTGKDTATVTVGNVAPVVTIDGPLVARRGVSTEFRGRAIDPGSDDLTLTWTWGDGATTVTESLVAPPAHDPDPSPQVKPRDLTDVRSHTWDKPCLYGTRIGIADDDGGTGQAALGVVVTGTSAVRHPVAYWSLRYHVDGPLCSLRGAAALSKVFDEAVDITTRQKAAVVLTPKSKDARVQLDAQLLAAWLNLADGSPRLDQLVDTNADGLPDTAFRKAMATAEAVRLDPGATSLALFAQVKVVNSINIER